MSWVRMDDRFWSNSKQLRLSDAAYRVWTCSWSYCAEKRPPTGFLTTEEALGLLRFLGKKQRVIRELVGKNAWEELSDGFLIHDLEDYLEEGSRERTRRWRERKRAASGNTESTGEAPHHPSRRDVTSGVTSDVTVTTRAGAPTRTGYPVPEPVPVVGDEVTPSVESFNPPVVPPSNALGAKAPDISDEVLQRWYELRGGQAPSPDDQAFAHQIPYRYSRLTDGQIRTEVEAVAHKFHDRPLPPLKYLAGRLEDLNTKASENGHASRRTRNGLSSIADVLNAAQERAR